MHQRVLHALLCGKPGGQPPDLERDHGPRATLARAPASA